MSVKHSELTGADLHNPKDHQHGKSDLPDKTAFKDEATTFEQAVTVQGNLILPNLPETDPGIAGALWLDSGVLKVSTGVS
jgi:hypothetical protein